MIDRLRQLAKLIAPGLDLYLLMQPPELPCPQGTTAYCVRGKYLALKNYLRQRGEWNGWRQAVIFVDDFADEEEAFGRLIHEVGHAMPSVKFSDREPTPIEAQLQTMRLTRWVDADPIEEQIEGVPWQGHAETFVRNILHLQYRARVAGVDVPNPAIFRPENYALSGLWRYRRALGDEPAELSCLPLQALEVISPPREFRRLFAADVAAWNKYKEKQK